MVVLSDIQNNPLPQQFLIYAEAYFEIAYGQCERLVQGSTQFNFAHGAAVMFLYRHGLELFLKSAILQKAPSERLNDHDLTRLNKRYKSLYPSKQHKLSLPWNLEEPDYEAFFDPQVADDIRKRIREMPDDQVYRYPANRESKPWNRREGIIPLSLLQDILATQREIARLKLILFPSNS